MKDFISILKSSLIRQSQRVTDRFNTVLPKKRNIGKNSYIDPSVHILGWDNVKIDRDSIIGEDTVININFRDAGKIGLIIGKNCFIGRRNIFITGISVKIGDYCMTGPNCCFLGSDHKFSSPFFPYITTGNTEDGLIEIGSNCWLGANVTILKNVNVGYGSILGASTVVNRDIPPLSVVVGNPCKVIRRFDMQSQAWVSVQDYPADGDQYLLNESEYLEILNKTSFDMKGVLIASSKAFGDI
jgi:acetyltransferase-like isoleucine patch superfamily enzyme